MNDKMFIFHIIGLGSLLGTIIYNFFLQIWVYSKLLNLLGLVNITASIFVLLYTFYLVCRFLRLIQKNKEENGNEKFKT